MTAHGGGEQGHGDGYHVLPDALHQITKGINEAVSELKELGFDTEAGLGRGFGKLELHDLEVGDAALKEAFADFSDKWNWGVRGLIGDANQFAERLGLSAGLYHDQEVYASHTMKNLWTGVAGNQYLSEDEVDKRSWGETVQDNSFSHIRHADYSPASVVEGYEGAKQAWGQAARDVRTSTATGALLPNSEAEWQPDGPPEPGSRVFRPADSQAPTAPEGEDEG